jgi:hypothetical protein
MQVLGHVPGRPAEPSHGPFPAAMPPARLPGHRIHRKRRIALSPAARSVPARQPGRQRPTVNPGCTWHLPRLDPHATSGRPGGAPRYSSGVHSKTAKPWSTLVGRMFSSSAIGGGGILPSISACMKPSPDSPAPPAIVAAWSYQVTTLERGGPHVSGCASRPAGAMWRGCGGWSGCLGLLIGFPPQGSRPPQRRALDASGPCPSAGSRR